MIGNLREFKNLTLLNAYLTPVGVDNFRNLFNNGRCLVKLSATYMLTIILLLPIGDFR